MEDVPVSRAFFLSLIFTLFLTDLAIAEISVSDQIVPEFAAMELEQPIALEQLPTREELSALGDVAPQLMNGWLATREDFAAVFRATIIANSGKRYSCSGSLVGPATFFFAAHCLVDGNTISLKIGNKTVMGKCSVAPGFHPISLDNDWSFCLLSNTISGIPYETLDISNPPTVGERVMPVGAGCTSQGGESDGRLRYGFSSIIPRPSNVRSQIGGIYTRADVDAGDAVLCKGDSGGPLFRATGPTGPRKILAVGSGVPPNLAASSYAATASSEGSWYATRWAEVNNQQICGVNRSLGCK